MHTGNHRFSMEAVPSGMADVAHMDEDVLREVREADLNRLRHAPEGMQDDEKGQSMLSAPGLHGLVIREHDFSQPVAVMLPEHRDA